MGEEKNIKAESKKTFQITNHKSQITTRGASHHQCWWALNFIACYG